MYWGHRFTSSDQMSRSLRENKEAESREILNKNDWSKLVQWRKKGNLKRNQLQGKTGKKKGMIDNTNGCDYPEC